MNQCSKTWYKYPTNGINKCSKNMVKYPTKHSNNIQNKRETNRQQQPKAVSGIQIPETLRNTATEHRPPPALSARRGRNPSADHLQPSTTAALALRNSPAGHIIPLGSSARSVPLSPVPRLKQTREIIPESKNQTQIHQHFIKLEAKNMEIQTINDHNNTRQKIKMKSNKYNQK